MDILVLSSEFPPYVLGGTSYHLLNLYNRIQNRGHEVTVLAGKCPQSYHELEDKVNSGIDVIPIEFGYRKGFYMLYPIALKNKLRNINSKGFDVAISHLPLPFKVAELQLATKYHDCVTEARPYIRQRLSLFEKIGDTLLHRYRIWAGKRSFEISDMAIFNSRLNRQAWNKHFDFSTPYSVIHNGVDIGTFYPENNEDEYVVFVGSIERKGLSRVVNYANQYHYPVHIVGDIEINHDNIVCHGRLSQEDLRKLYSGAIATIHPAKFEAFGNTILESLACGTPVVASNNCGASELLTDRSGIVTNNIREGVEQAQHLSSQNCLRVAKEHTWDEVAIRTINCLRQLC